MVDECFVEPGLEYLFSVFRIFSKTNQPGDIGPLAMKISNEKVGNGLSDKLS